VLFVFFYPFTPCLENETSAKHGNKGGDISRRGWSPANRGEGREAVVPTQRR